MVEHNDGLSQEVAQPEEETKRGMLQRREVTDSRIGERRNFLRAARSSDFHSVMRAFAEDDYKTVLFHDFDKARMPVEEHALMDIAHEEVHRMVLEMANEYPDDIVRRMIFIVHNGYNQALWGDQDCYREWQRDITEGYKIQLDEEVPGTGI